MATLARINGTDRSRLETAEPSPSRPADRTSDRHDVGPALLMCPITSVSRKRGTMTWFSRNSSRGTEGFLAGRGGRVARTPITADAFNGWTERGHGGAEPRLEQFEGARPGRSTRAAPTPVARSSGTAKRSMPSVSNRGRDRAARVGARPPAAVRARRAPRRSRADPPHPRARGQDRVVDLDHDLATRGGRPPASPRARSSRRSTRSIAPRRRRLPVSERSDLGTGCRFRGSRKNTGQT